MQPGQTVWEVCILNGRTANAGKGNSRKQEYCDAKQGNAAVENGRQARQCRAAACRSRVLVDSLQPAQYREYACYLTLESEIKGRVRRTAWYLKSGCRAGLLMSIIMLHRDGVGFAGRGMSEQEPVVEFCPKRRTVINAKVTDRPNGASGQKNYYWPLPCRAKALY